MESSYKPNTDYIALLNGLSMLKSIVEDILNGNGDQRLDAMSFYSGFRLAADGFVEAGYGASQDKHKELIRRELSKYIAEVRALAETQTGNNILKFPEGKPQA